MENSKHEDTQIVMVENIDAAGVGNFDGLTVYQTGVVSHGGKYDANARFINPYTFYIHLDEGNDQIWTLTPNGYQQICNTVDLDDIKLLHEPLGQPVGDLCSGKSKRLLACTGGKITEDFFCRCDQKISITWWNPDTFYFKSPNSQVWTFDVGRNGYIQLGTWQKSVWNGITGEEGRFYPVE